MPTLRERAPFAAVGVIGAMALIGVLLIAIGFAAISGPPKPDGKPSALDIEPGEPGVGGQYYLGRSKPTRIDIPAIDVRAPVRPMGAQGDGELQIPPLSRPHQAGWYRDGVSPGEIGAAVIVGHVDSSRTGEAVFYALGAIKEGTIVEVTRSDDTVATFRVDAIGSYTKKEFPTDLVYGSADHAALRLITCSGTFDSKTGDYTENVIVFASLAETRTLTAEDRQRPLRNYIPKKRRR